ncbi:MAG: DNA-binding response regulator [Chloroflexi bacterium]|nr:MAG: DNA-binding response regulator [Chloroflexota bacterium]MBL1195022.1 DNA-binding response regulator [Chloroflexota bacterium]NOH12311.1 response regulator transcription factor [Chloroflexota bacterium]
MSSNKVRVLITDDQSAARQGLKALLARIQDIEVVGEATNGQEAVDLAAVYQPDVVLMDIKMPKMDGLEATQRIKSKCPAVNVVILTLHSKYRQQALAAGADAFLLKGGNTELLWNTMFQAKRRSKT